MLDYAIRGGIIVDGADADKFLAYVKKQLESYPDA